MSPFARIIITIATLLFAICISPVVAEEADDATLKQPLWGDEIRRQGTELLKQERWREAGEMLGTMSAEYSVAIAWDWSESLSAERRDQYRFALVDFHVRHSRLSAYYWSSTARQIQRYGAEYQAIVARGDFKADEILDFSNLDLVDAAAILNRKESTKAMEASYERICEVLQERPENIPAIACLVSLLPQRYTPKDEERWRRATELLTGQIGRLALARHIIPPMKGEGTQWCERIIEQSYQLAPTNEERAAIRMKAARWWQNKLPRYEIPDEIAREVFSRARIIYKTLPATRNAADARILAAKIINDTRGPDRALQFIRELARWDKDHTDGIDRALFNISTEYFKQQQYDRSEAILLEIFERKPKTSLTSRAALGLSEVYDKQGKLDLKLEWLKRCVGIEFTEPTATNIMDTDNTRSKAIQRLAWNCELRGQWQRALTLWESWKPRSFCGTCLVGMHDSQNRAIARCKLGLGRFDEAARLLLENVFDVHLGESPERFTITLTKLYHDAGQLDDLSKMQQAFREILEEEVLKPHDYEELNTERSRQFQRKRNDEYADKVDKVIEEASLYYRLSEARKIDELIGRCRQIKKGDFDYPGFNPVTELLIKATADCGDLAIDRAAREIAASKEMMPRWMIHVLGRHRSVAALMLLLEEAYTHDLGNQYLTDAIARHGTEAVDRYERLLEQTASQGTRKQRTEKERLNKKIEGLHQALKLGGPPYNHDELHWQIDDFKLQIKEIDKQIARVVEYAPQRLPAMRSIASNVPTHVPLPRPEPGSLPKSLPKSFYED